MHTEKQEIFDKYAKEQGYKDWESIIFEFEVRFANSDELNLHIFAACDLVQQEQQKRIADESISVYLNTGEEEIVLKASIINPENLIK